MEIVLFVCGCVLLLVAIGLSHRSAVGSITARFEALDRNLERADRATQDEFRSNRREAAESLQRLGESLVQAHGAVGEGQANQLQIFGQQLAAFMSSVADQVALLRTEMSQAITSAATTTTNSIAEVSRLSLERFDGLSTSLADRMTALETRSGDELSAIRREFQGAAEALRDRLTGALAEAAVGQNGKLTELATLQEQQWGGFRAQIDTLRVGVENTVETLRASVEQRLRDLQQDNATKLDQMRQTVDEKLQSTLETRLGESFRQVSDRLDQVHKGLGEMQVLATGVGDLKRVLTNVKARGAWGEVQLSSLLEQVLAREQYDSNVATGDGGERVEFAIRLPGRSGKDDEPAWLPIDAKFPLEDYQALTEAADRADALALDEAGRRLEACVKNCAKDISTKYINPPKTTDFAIMFLPNEGLYAEVLRRPALAETLQRQYRVIIAGPTTLWAILTSLQMGFRTLAIERRSSEVWGVLGAVKTEFGKFGAVLGAVEKHLHHATNKIGMARKGTRTIERKLTDVQALPAPEVAVLLEEPLFELVGPDDQLASQ